MQRGSSKLVTRSERLGLSATQHQPCRWFFAGSSARASAAILLLGLKYGKWVKSDVVEAIKTRKAQRPTPDSVPYAAPATQPRNACKAPSRAVPSRTPQETQSRQSKKETAGSGCRRQRCAG